MLTVEEALEHVRSHAQALPVERRSLREAAGCCLAEDITADADQPPFDKSMVDGYALRSADLADARYRLRLVETIAAGHLPNRPLGPGETAAIMTGAPLPSGADAVVMHERTTVVDDQVAFDERDRVRPGQNWLNQGAIYRRGVVVLRRGALLTAPRIGLLASVGCGTVQVIARPEVRLVPTGDELVEPEQVPGPGQIRNSNSLMLEALAHREGAATQVCGIVRDDCEMLRSVLREGLQSDLLVISGGVSAGQRDLVPGTLEQIGVREVFHKVRLKPGKPLWFGVGPAREDRPGTLVFGLPGNPASSLVGFLLLVRPAIGLLSGRGEPPCALRLGRLGTEFRQKGDRPTYYPARWIDPGADDRKGTEKEGKKGKGRDKDRESRGVIEPVNWAGSADLLGISQADGFAVFPAGDRVFSPGEMVQFLPL